jgi:hypothetical protein
MKSFITSPSVIRIIKSRGMRWAGREFELGIKGLQIDYWWKSQKERDH